MVDELGRAADMLDQLNLVQTLDDIPTEHVPRKISENSSGTVRLTLRKDMVLNADLGVNGDYQPLVFTGGGPLVVDEPCVIIRSNPHSNDDH